MRFARPETLHEAVGLIAQEMGLIRILSGGTDVMVQLKAGLVSPL
jgi:CO/xanthine dehydrogenase FAD-binding subunit